MVEPETFDSVYRRGGLPEADRDKWVEVLLRYPRDTKACAGLPNLDDVSVALDVSERGEIPDDHDAVHRYAWEVTKTRLGVERLLAAVDAYEVAGYVQHGGGLTEARGYLDAVRNARTPANTLWTVWAAFDLCFSSTRFEMYRRTCVSPEDLAWFVDQGQYKTWNDVVSVIRWAPQLGAPFRVVASYRMHSLTPEDITAWEERRATGQDVVAALAMLAALSADPP